MFFKKNKKKHEYDFIKSLSNVCDRKILLQKEEDSFLLILQFDENNSKKDDIHAFLKQINYVLKKIKYFNLDVVVIFGGQEIVISDPSLPPPSIIVFEKYLEEGKCEKIKNIFQEINLDSKKVDCSFIFENLGPYKIEKGIIIKSGKRKSLEV